MHAIGYLVGAGSISLGVEAAGATLQSIYETPGYSKNARTWDLNRPDDAHSVIELGDITGFVSCASGADIIYGNPPCGGLSSMTGSKLESPTNNCMVEWAAMVAKAQPKHFLMENAHQLALPRCKPLYDKVSNIFRENGYYVWHWSFMSWQVGAPQLRRRMFLVGSKDKPRDDVMDLSDLPSDDVVGACKPYLQDLFGIEPSEQNVVTQRGATLTQHTYDTYGWLRTNHLREHSPLIRSYVGTAYLLPDEAEKLSMSDSPADKKRLERTKIWYDSPKNFVGKMHAMRPRHVSLNKPVGAIIGVFQHLHPIDNRLLTMRELARLMGYPDNWEFHTIRPHLIAQGVPAFNSKWAVKRLQERAFVRG